MCVQTVGFLLKNYMFIFFVLMCMLLPKALLASSSVVRIVDVDQAIQGQYDVQPVLKLEPVNVVVSIRPIALLVNQIIPKNAKSFWSLDVLVPPQSSVHDYQFKPSDVLKLKNADAFFWLGSESEPNIEKVLSRFSVNHYGFDYSTVRWRMLDKEGHGHHDHDHGSQIDPHIWLSLPQVPNMLRYITDQLIQLLDNEKLFKNKGWTKQQIAQQRQMLQQRLKDALVIHEEVTRKIRRLQLTWVHNKYVTFHNAFGYLDQAFNIQSLGSFVNNPEDGISPRQIRHLQNMLKAKNVGCLILEPAADGRGIESLLKSKISVVDVDILGNVLPSNLDWREFWEYLAEKMQACFGGG